MSGLKPIAAIAFDLDDTLCTYWDAAKQGLRETFNELVPKGLTVDDLLVAWSEAFHQFCPNLRALGMYEAYLESGKPTRDELMRRTLALLNIHDEALTTALGDTYALRRRRALKLFPEIPQLLSDLHGRVPLALITNGPADIQREEIQDLDLGHRFDLVLIEGEQKLGKPHPEVLARAERHFGAPVEQLLFVGNSYGHDIRPAIEAGWKTVWVRRPSDIPPSHHRDSDKGKPLPEELPAGAPRPTLIVSDLAGLSDLV
jgi:putative hydrolase of the HAD superfamily